MEPILFRETQYMSGGWVPVAVIAIFLLITLSQYRRMKGFTRAVLVGVLIILTATAVILFTLKLETVYYPHRVAHRFASFFGTGYDTISLDSVSSVQVLTYDPMQYGGWGMKGDKNTEVYNAAGNKGILFTFAGGRRLLLGTQHPDTLYARLKGYYPLDK